MTEQTTNFHPVQFSEMADTPFTDFDWLWDQYLVRGSVTLLVAYAKVGKTTFVYPLCRAIQTGRPFVGHRTQQANVLILAVEEHPKLIEKRAHELELIRLPGMWTHVGPLDYSKATFAALAAFVKKHQIGLLVVDTLANFWNVRDEDDNAEVREQMKRFRALALTTGVTVLLLYHESKRGGKGGRGIRGAGALFAAVDEALILTAPGADPTKTTMRTLTVLGRFGLPPALNVELDGVDFRLVGEAPGRQEKVTKLLGALDGEWRTVPDLAQRSDLPEKEVRRLLEPPPGGIESEGRGVKGDPIRFRNSYSRPPLGGGAAGTNHGFVANRESPRIATNTNRPWWPFAPGRTVLTGAPRYTRAEVAASLREKEAALKAQVPGNEGE